MTYDGSVIWLCFWIGLLVSLLAFFLGFIFGEMSGESISADHALALAYGDSLENHKEWLNALIDARARKEKRNV